MGIYSEFAGVYDRLMSDVDYKARTEYLINLFEKYDRKPTLLLDVACGTGGFSNEFKVAGTDVIGVDMSEEMLAFARKNSAERGTDILYLCQMAQELDLYGTVDGAVCCLDSLNHIIDYDELCKSLQRISLFLEKERLFIFDVNTVFKHKYILADNTYIIERNGVYCVWQNFFDNDMLTTDISLDFFEEENGLYKRGTEDFSERAYTSAELKTALDSAGLKTEAIYDDMTESTPGKEAERVIYITRKS